MLPVRIAVQGEEWTLAETESPLRFGSFFAGAPPSVWEVEIGFGKGRYLLAQARARPEVGFVGIEVASKYYRSVRHRCRELPNLVLLRGEAVYLMASVLPPDFARAVHVYFPDPWPKSRHHGRRLFEPESLDLILRLMEPGGSLLFATDSQDYGAMVRRLLEEHPGLSVTDAGDQWGVLPRTHYEDKYQREGRAIVRLEARLDSRAELVHPRAGLGVVAAVAQWRDPEEDRFS
ncbi:MAG: tRNA (guanine(46)-N(7))-methyltransferase TrmB [Thermoanaerobaculia bacterium]